MKNGRPRITVVGSLNIDFTFRLPRIPKPGETLTAREMQVQFGGKGSNQAIAAARAGADVTLIGCIGDDEHGRRYRTYLENQGVQTRSLELQNAPTGCAFIAVDDHAENTIVVHPGANDCLSVEHIARCEDDIRNSDALLLQLECPLAIVAQAVKIAKSAGIRVIINPSPFSAAALSALSDADIWIVNESEFGLLAESSAPHAERDPSVILSSLGGSALVITRGSDPTLLVTDSHSVSIAPPRVEPVDTVGAGDTFAGAFAVALCEAQPLSECVRFANAAGALATLQPGAQTAIPNRVLIETMLKE